MDSLLSRPFPCREYLALMNAGDSNLVNDLFTRRLKYIFIALFSQFLLDFEPLPPGFIPATDEDYTFFVRYDFFFFSKRSKSRVENLFGN